MDLVVTHEWTKFSNVLVHGDSLAGKPSNTIRVYFENIDGFRVDPKQSLRNNKNLTYYNNLITRLDIDIVGGAEARTNWGLVPTSHSLQKVLNLREGSRCVSAYNWHEKFLVNQQGGTFVATQSSLMDAYVKCGSDDEGLGQWSWIQLAGKNSTTQVITAYQPCKTRKTAKNATLAQQRHYWRIQGDYHCPRKLFRLQLL